MSFSSRETCSQLTGTWDLILQEQSVSLMVTPGGAPMLHVATLLLFAEDRQNSMADEESTSNAAGRENPGSCCIWSWALYSAETVTVWSTKASQQRKNEGSSSSYFHYLTYFSSQHLDIRNKKSLKKVNANSWSTFLLPCSLQHTLAWNKIFHCDMLSPSWKRIKIIAFGEPNYLDGRMHHQAVLNNLLAVWACLAFISVFLVLLIVLHTSLLLLMNPRTIKMDFCSDHHSLLGKEFDRAHSDFGIQHTFSHVSGKAASRADLCNANNLSSSSRCT